MLILCVEIMKIIDAINRNAKKYKKQKPKTENNKVGGGGRNYSERVKATWLCYTFRLGFFQLICKASLTFRSSFELASSIILKQSELYESKYVPIECKSLEIWDFYLFWYVPQS